MSGLTRCRSPPTVHHSGAMPAAAASRASISGSAALGLRPLAGVSARARTERGAMGMASSDVGPARASSALSQSRVQPKPSRGSGSTRCSGASPRWIARTTRSSPSPVGSARIMTRDCPRRSSHSAGSSGAPSALRQATSGSGPPPLGAPVRKRSALNAGWARRMAVSREAKASRPSSLEGQSSQLTALSWA